MLVMRSLYFIHLPSLKLVGQTSSSTIKQYNLILAKGLAKTSDSLWQGYD